MDTRQREQPSTPQESFNGAMPFQAWIHADMEMSSKAIKALQWGHALSGMDTRIAASAKALVFLLQWGHALSGMDTLDTPRDLSGQTQLQWGHALSGMDTLTVDDATTKILCFNGAMPFQAWIQFQVHWASWNAYGFNGAMPFQAWIPLS